MKKIVVLLLAAAILFTCSSCKLVQFANEIKKRAGSTDAIDAVITAPAGSPDWCRAKTAQEIINKYVFVDASEVYWVSDLLGIVEFRGGSYCGANMEFLASGNEGEGKPCGTVYFNEDGSDVWVHYEMYEGYGTDSHFVNGKLVERIPSEEWDD